jgi:hypothetical protein
MTQQPEDEELEERIVGRSLLKLDKLEPLCYPDFGLTVLLRV